MTAILRFEVFISYFFIFTSFVLYGLGTYAVTLWTDIYCSNDSGTKQAAHRLKILFGLAGFKAAELHGNLTQAQRLDVSFESLILAL